MEPVKRIRSLLPVVILISCLATFPLCGGGSDLYPWPTNWSLGGLASWSLPIIASSAALPPVASGSIGEFFIVTDAASWTLYRNDGTDWVQLVASGTGSGGTSDHSALSNLGFTESAHTGFASESALTDHIASQTDPHGASMTVSEGLTIGSGTADTFISRYATGTAMISYYIAIPYELATPTPASGVFTIWGDENTGKVRIHDGDATWRDLW